MNELYTKICLVIGEILCYSRKIKWAMAPVFDTDTVIMRFLDDNNNSMEIPVQYSVINKVHDHSLETMIFNLLKVNDLL